MTNLQLIIVNLERYGCEVVVINYLEVSSEEECIIIKEVQNARNN